MQQRSNCISWPGPAVYNQRVCPKRRAGKADPPRVRAYVWKKKKDYRAVLKEILDLLPSSISVRKVTLDFERAVWTVFRELLPDVAFQGCLFHWTQALWRKVRIIYYQPSNKSTKRVKITNTKSIHTNGEKKQTNKQKKLRYVTDYVLTYFVSFFFNIINTRAWTRASVEGWHHSLNRRSGNKVHLPFYLLVELLNEESRLVSIQIRLVSDGKLLRIQRKKYQQLQERVFNHREDFNSKKISARRLLKLCSYLNGPVGRS